MTTAPDPFAPADWTDYDFPEPEPKRDAPRFPFPHPPPDDKHLTADPWTGHMKPAAPWTGDWDCTDPHYAHLWVLTGGGMRQCTGCGETEEAGV